jgi:hypothetical protein
MRDAKYQQQWYRPARLTASHTLPLLSLLDQHIVLTNTADATAALAAATASAATACAQHNCTLAALNTANTQEGP